MYPKWYMSWHSLFISIESCFPHIRLPSPFISNLASLQLQIRLKVHHLCSTVWDTKYPNLQNRTLMNKWLSLMKCKKWRSKITSKLQTCHEMMFVSPLSPPVYLYLTGVMHHFFFQPVPKMLNFEGWLFFIFRLANGSQYDPNYNSRVRVITFLYDLIRSTYRSYRHRYKGTIYTRERERESTQDTFLKKPHTPKLVWFVYKIIRDLSMKMFNDSQLQSCHHRLMQHWNG